MMFPTLVAVVPVMSTGANQRLVSWSVYFLYRGVERHKTVFPS